jgi:hypothetical protein
MKKNIIYLLLISSVLFSGCEKFLEENPKSLITFNNIDEDILESAIVGLYEPLTRSRGRLWESHYTTHLVSLAEYTHSRILSREKLCQYKFADFSAYSDHAWPTFYEAISRSNILIKQLEENTDIDEQLKNEAFGEAYFVRATCYFHLVRGWGKVPLRLEPVTDSQNTGQPLAEVDDIYDQIIADLKFAEQNLSPKTNKPGRATSGAVKTELADVYLFLGRYNDARSLAKEIMDNKAEYGYDLIPSIETLFSPTSPTNSEDIFSIKFSQFVAQGSFIPTYFSTINYSGLTAPRGLEVVGATDTAALIRNWDDNDLRKKWNIYNTWVIDGQEENLSIAAPNDYVFGKYRDPEAPDETGAGNDIYLYRYADVLLIFAETENNINGPTADAYEAVNKVRRRAYGKDINASDTEADLPVGLTQSAFDDMVFRERGYEFMAEGKRWFDLVRTGRWQTLIPEAGKDLPSTLYWPIPGKETLYNDEID